MTVTLGQRLVDSACQQHSDYFQCDDERKRPVFITLSDLVKTVTLGYCTVASYTACGFYYSSADGEVVIVSVRQCLEHQEIGS